MKWLLGLFKSPIRKAIEKVVDAQVAVAEKNFQQDQVQLLEDYKAAVIKAERRAIEEVLTGVFNFKA
jgi:hypothetical protein